MQALWKLYHESLPPFLAEAARTPPMLRLQGVGMNCGCEYTAFRRFAGLHPYSRWDHSVGVGLIVWHFTQDRAQALAGLLHDIATPTFAHVVDFLRGDHLRQEATEAGTRRIIEQSPALQALLRREGLTTDEVCDYHVYPMADNDAPRLCADRLEYTLGNLVNFDLYEPSALRPFYEDVVAAENEDGETELTFQNAEIALRFAEGALACAQVYVSDEDRFAMQALAELLAEAIAAGALCEADLMTDEPALLRKLCAAPGWEARWRRFCAMHALERTDSPKGEGWRKIDAKRRRIDPYVCRQGRVSALFPAFGARLRDFAAQPFDYWLREKDAL